MYVGCHRETELRAFNHHERGNLGLGQKAEQELSREGNGQSRWFLYQRVWEVGTGWEGNRHDPRWCVSGTPTSLALLECGGWEVRCRRGSLSDCGRPGVDLRGSGPADRSCVLWAAGKQSRCCHLRLCLKCSQTMLFISQTHNEFRKSLLMYEWGHGTFKIHFVIIKSYMYLDEKIKLFYKASNDKQQSPTYPFHHQSPLPLNI